MSLPNRFRVDHGHPDHPDLRGRKELLGSLLVASHLCLGRKATQLKGTGAAMLVRVRERAEIDDEPLDEFLAFLASSARDYAEARRIPADQEALAKFVTSVERLVCSDCPAATKCTGNRVSDPRAVASGGLCVTPLTRDFDTLMALAGRIYGKVLADEGALDLRFNSAIGKDDAGPGARTLFPQADALGARCATVELSLPLRKLEPQHVVGLPYLLFHELFVHGPEAWSTIGRRPATPETCSFREGFVDAAAAFLLKTELNRGAIHLLGDTGLSSTIAFATSTGHQLRATLVAGGHADLPVNHVPSLRQAGALLFQRFADRHYGHHAVLLAATMNSWSDPLPMRGSYLVALEELAEALALTEATPRATSDLLFMLGDALADGAKVDASAIRQWLLSCAPIDTEDF